MTESTAALIVGLFSSERYKCFHDWLTCWQPWPGAIPNIETALWYARRLERLNDAQIEFIQALGRA